MDIEIPDEDDIKQLAKEMICERFGHEKWDEGYVTNFNGKKFMKCKHCMVNRYEYEGDWDNNYTPTTQQTENKTTTKEG